MVLSELKQSASVAVVGGGIIGCAIAYYLRKANISVTILDQGDIGGGRERMSSGTQWSRQSVAGWGQASSAAAGLLAPLGPLSGPGPLADLLLASFGLFPSLIPEL